MLFIIIAIGVVWVNVGSYARVETVPGILVTDVPSAKVVARQSGVIAEMQVSEGQIVKQGERLLVINSDRQTEAGGDVASRSIGALTARQQLSEAQVAMASGRAAAERTRLQSVIASAEDQARNLTGQIALQEEVVASNQQIFDQIQQVVERGFVSKVEFERRRQTLLSSQQNLATLVQRRMASLAEADQARSQLASVNIDAAQGISRIQDTLQSLSAEQARLEGEQSYVITAPIDGRVTALAAGVGRTANPNRPLMVIVPQDAELTAEIYAPTRAIGLVEPGKEARLLFDAFPYQRFGSFGGSVKSISRIAVDPRETDIPFPFEEPVYRVRVTLDQQTVEAYGEPAPLQAGMTLQANIVLERQSFLGWILQPLNAVLNRNS
ncbi:HlyD family efflux transporter periplasmic adaptor subunit [Erythrobacter sp. F6033]|uniref:HlyD family secretion protein n=1 Tax=Erythrobacter sp. F6033 TaxID=2926401 RepID=UPI001FF3E9D8|nr:HlyD family efflux transporter periplasmic adaptor subunit [Erythrobacter sp. F6033]